MNQDPIVVKLPINILKPVFVAWTAEEMKENQPPIDFDGLIDSDVTFKQIEENILPKLNQRDFSIG